MILPSSRCSITCALQPVVRAITNSGVNIGVKEDKATDDNPDITDYYGHGRLAALYRWKGNSLAGEIRGNLSTGKGAVKVGWFSPPLIGPFRGYVQVFSGYGETMIDYNWKQTTVGIGLALNDGL